MNKYIGSGSYMIKGPDSKYLPKQNTIKSHMRKLSPEQRAKVRCEGANIAAENQIRNGTYTKTGWIIVQNDTPLSMLFATRKRARVVKKYGNNPKHRIIKVMLIQIGT